MTNETKQMDKPRTIRINAEGFGEIVLARGLVALIDAADIPIVKDCSWSIYKASRTFYATTNFVKDRKRIKLHRLVLSAPDGFSVDHINGDGLDNRRSNLRLCSNAENIRNQQKQKRKTSSRFKGVTLYRGIRGSRWRGYIHYNSKKYRLGSFGTEIEAAQAYNKAALEFFGQFARLNVISPKPLEESE